MTRYPLIEQPIGCIESARAVARKRLMIFIKKIFEMNRSPSERGKVARRQKLPE